MARNTLINSTISHRVGIRNISDYSPFGVLLPERTVESAFFRLGFQGQEHDDEVKGEGNSVNFKYRMHDPRVGRFFAVDPLSHNFPYNGLYNFSENKVIAFIELEGLQTTPSNSRSGNARYMYQNGGSTRVWVVGNSTQWRVNRGNLRPSTIVPRTEVEIDIDKNQLKPIIELMNHVVDDWDLKTFTYKPRVPVPDKFQGDIEIVEYNYNYNGTKFHLVDGMTIDFTSPEDRMAWENLEKDFYVQLNEEVDRRLQELGYDQKKCIPCVGGSTTDGNGNVIVGNNKTNEASPQLREAVTKWVKMEMGSSPMEKLIQDIKTKGTRTESVLKETIMQ